jgi:hypothetical protein
MLRRGVYKWTRFLACTVIFFYSTSLIAESFSSVTRAYAVSTFGTMLAFDAFSGGAELMNGTTRLARQAARWMEILPLQGLRRIVVLAYVTHELALETGA